MGKKPDRVSIPWSMLLSAIPIVGLIAFYRIEKLRNAILQITVPLFVLMIILSFFTPHYYLVSKLLVIPWSVLLMYGWAKRWNEK